MDRSDLPRGLRDRPLSELPRRWQGLLADEVVPTAPPKPEPEPEPEPEPTPEEVDTRTAALEKERINNSERQAARAAVRAILDDINTEIDRARAVKATANATINSKPAPYVVDNATAIIRLGNAVKGLARFVSNL